MRLRPMLIAVGTLSVLAITTASAWGNNPPGNNGTVKVGGVLDDTKGQESHVGCQFQIEFSGYDEGPLYGRASLELVPSSGSVEVYKESIFIGGDAAGGANDSDSTLEVDLLDPLAAVEPHSQQGFHVKLTVHADGSIGADTKHKTFWGATAVAARKRARVERSSPHRIPASVEQPRLGSGHLHPFLGDQDAAGVQTSGARLKR